MAQLEIYERYSIIKIQNIVKEAIKEISISDLSRQSGVARTTIYDLINGDLPDMLLSTASKLVVAIKELKCKKTLDNV